MNAISNRSNIVHRMRNHPHPHHPLIYKQPIDGLRAQARHVPYSSSPAAYLRHSTVANSPSGNLNVDASSRQRNVTNILLDNIGSPMTDRLAHYAMFGAINKSPRLSTPIYSAEDVGNLVESNQGIVGQSSAEKAATMDRLSSHKVHIRSQQSCCSTESDEDSDEVIVDVEQVYDTQSHESLDKNPLTAIQNHGIGTFNHFETSVSHDLQQAITADVCALKMDENDLLEKLEPQARKNQSNYSKTIADSATIMNDSQTTSLGKSRNSDALTSGLVKLNECSYGESRHVAQDPEHNGLVGEGLFRNRLIYDSVFASFLSHLGGSIDSQALMALFLKNNTLMIEQSINLDHPKTMHNEQKFAMVDPSQQHYQAGNNPSYPDVRGAAMRPTASSSSSNNQQSYIHDPLRDYDVRIPESSKLSDNSHLKSCLSGNSPLPGLATTSHDNHSPMHERQSRISQSYSGVGTTKVQKANSMMTSEDQVKQTVWRQHIKTSTHEPSFSRVTELGLYVPQRDRFMPNSTSHKQRDLYDSIATKASSSSTDFKNINSLVMPPMSISSRDHRTDAPTRGMFRSNWSDARESVSEQ